MYFIMPLILQLDRIYVPYKFPNTRYGQYPTGYSQPSLNKRAAGWVLRCFLNTHFVFIQYVFALCLFYLKLLSKPWKHDAPNGVVIDYILGQ